MTLLVIYSILLLVYMFCPKHLKAVACIINFFFPDPIPGIDEVIMIVGLLA